MVQDSRLPPPRVPRGFMSRMILSDLRPVVICGAFFAILWSLASGISSFRNVPLFNNNNDRGLGTFYIIFGAIYMGVVVIEAFGLFAAASRRVAAVRLFAYLSVLVTLMNAAVYILQTVVHFTFKNDILSVCTNVNTGDEVFFTGFFGPIDGGVLTPEEAQDWCSQHFDRDSFSNVVALLATTAVSALFVFFVFGYLRQLQDPSSAANASRDPIRMDAYPARYNPPYNRSYNQYSGPPNMSGDAFVPPPYESGDTKLPKYEGGDYKGPYGDQKDDSF